MRRRAFAATPTQEGGPGPATPLLPRPPATSQQPAPRTALPSPPTPSLETRPGPAQGRGAAARNRHSAPAAPRLGLARAHPVLPRRPAHGPHRPRPLLTDPAGARRGRQTAWQTLTAQCSIAPGLGSGLTARSTPAPTEPVTCRPQPSADSPRHCAGAAPPGRGGAGRPARGGERGGRGAPAGPAVASGRGGARGGLPGGRGSRAPLPSWASAGFWFLRASSSPRTGLSLGDARTPAGLSGAGCGAFPGKPGQAASPVSWGRRVEPAQAGRDDSETLTDFQGFLTGCLWVYSARR